MRPSPLTRRQALQAAGSTIMLSIAGCSMDSERGDTPTPTSTQTVTSSPTQTGTPTKTPTANLPPIENDDVAFNVEVLQPFTDEHPAEIEATLENTRDDPVTASGGATFPFGFSHGEHTEGESTLLAIPSDTEHLQTDPADENFVPAEPTDGCWTVDYELLVEAIGREGELAPEDVHRMEYTVLDHDNDACLPPGAYRFAYSLNVRPGKYEERDQYETVSMTFVFTLMIGNDGTLSAEVDEPRVEG